MDLSFKCYEDYIEACSAFA